MTHDTIHRHAVPCECGCDCVLITEFDQWGDDPEQVIVEFGVANNVVGFRHRAGIAWKILRGKDPWMHGVALQGETLAQMREIWK